MNIPDQPFVALYGSHPGEWRETCIDLLSKKNIRWYDPTDERWENITDKNGDQMQAVVNHLVAKEQQGLLEASCVIFNLSHPPSHSLSRTRKPKEIESSAQKFLAARCELGFLVGTGIYTLVYIGPDVAGRNYLWASMKHSRRMIRCRTLVDATNRAIRYMQSLAASE